MRDAALDASCDLKYYASDHFASQAGLQLQGEMQNDTKVRTLDPNPNLLTLTLTPTLTLTLTLTPY